MSVDIHYLGVEDWPMTQAGPEPGEGSRAARTGVTSTAALSEYSGRRLRALAGLDKRRSIHGGGGRGLPHFWQNAAARELPPPQDGQ